MNDCFELSLATRITAETASEPIRQGINMLRRDMREILTERGADNEIRVALDAAMPPESYHIHVEPARVSLICADELGAIYALLSISERFLGVKPLDWWHDIARPRLPRVCIPVRDHDSPHYAVRYRGWFVNDEVLLEGWHDSISDRFAVWKRVFEAILRCGGNMVIAGTDRLHDGEALCALAASMGLWITQHHSELLGAKMFSRVYPDLTPSYAENPEAFEAIWRESVRNNRGRKVVWAIGYRGQGDMAFWHSDSAAGSDEAARGEYIVRIMRRQMEIVREENPDAVFVTNLYGEMMQMYRNGHLAVPDEVIKVWGDNGFGKMVSRRQNNENPRVCSMPDENEPGLNGVYWHVGFYDLQAANHITLLQEPPQAVADELETLIRHHGHTYWNVNVGSIRPHLFMLDLICRMWRDGSCDAEQAAAEYARDYFGDERIGTLITSYAEQTVKYGPNDDDRAGDQFYHFPLRWMLRAYIRGQREEPLESLKWLADASSFREQVTRVYRMVAPGCKSWRQWVKACDAAADELAEPQALLLKNTLGLSGMIHLAGCEGMADFCQAMLYALSGDDLSAFQWADEAIRCERKALDAMARADVGQFTGFYRNDCFTNVKLTVQALETLRGMLRISGDGDNWYDWEHAYLTMDPSCRVLLQTHVTNQLSDAELAARLRTAIPLKMNPLVSSR